MKINKQWSWLIWFRIQIASLIGRGTFLNIIETFEIESGLTSHEPDFLKAGDSSLPEVVKSENNLPA